jgi:Tfp pilus assembly protein PilW
MKFFSKKNKKDTAHSLSGNVFYNTQQSGYLLIEIMVSLAIFALIATASIGAVLSVLSANGKSQAYKSVIDNTSVAVENMSRAIRTGTGYECLSGHNIPRATIYTDSTNTRPDNCPSGANGISFLPQDATDNNDRVEYYFNSSDKAIYRYRQTLDGNTVGSRVTAPEVTINKAQFFVFGDNYLDQLTTNDPNSTVSATQQPRVFISINGTAAENGATNAQARNTTPFNIQTTVSERSLVGSSALTAVGTNPGPGGGCTSNCGTGGSCTTDCAQFCSSFNPTMGTFVIEPYCTAVYIYSGYFAYSARVWLITAYNSTTGDFTAIDPFYNNTVSGKVSNSSFTFYADEGAGYWWKSTGSLGIEKDGSDRNWFMGNWVDAKNYIGVYGAELEKGYIDENNNLYQSVDRYYPNP